MPFDERSGLFDVGEFDEAEFDMLSVPDLEDTATVSETKEKEVGKNVTENSSLNDNITDRAIDKGFKEDAYLTESFNLFKIWNIELHDYGYAVDEFSKLIAREEADAINTADFISKLIGFSEKLNEMSSLADVFEKEIGKNVIDSVNSIDTFQKTVTKGLQEVSTIIEDFEKTKGIFLNDAIEVIDQRCVNRISGVISTIQEDLRTVMYDLMNEQVNLIKSTDVTDGGFIEDIDQVTFCVDCRIVPLSQKDRNLLPLGEVTTGNMTAYFLPSYDYKGQTYEVEESDIIVDSKNDVQYRVLKIVQREHLNTKVVYIKALLQRI